MKSEIDIEFSNEGVIHEDVVRKALSEQPAEESLPGGLVRRFCRDAVLIAVFPREIVGRTGHRQLLTAFKSSCSDPLYA